jgi:hypothetical protein
MSSFDPRRDAGELGTDSAVGAGCHANGSAPLARPLMRLALTRWETPWERRERASGSGEFDDFSRRREKLSWGHGVARSRKDWRTSRGLPSASDPETEADRTQGESLLACMTANQ